MEKLCEWDYFFFEVSGESVMNYLLPALNNIFQKKSRFYHVWNSAVSEKDRDVSVSKVFENFSLQGGPHSVRCQKIVF